MSSETYETLCKKHGLSKQAIAEFKAYFDKEIIKVFGRISSEMNAGGVVKVSKVNKISKGESICIGKKQDGTACTTKSKPDSDYCGRHNPNKPPRISKNGTIAKIRTKKEMAPPTNCHAVIVKTGKPCILPASVKPEGSDFYYCRRHAEKWIEFEPEIEVAEECEDEEEIEEGEEVEEVEEEVEEEE